MDQTSKNTDDSCSNNSILFCFHDESPNATEIKRELALFFKSWGRNFEIIEYSTKNENKEEEKIDKLKASSILLQLFSEDSEISKKMKSDRDIYRRIQSGKLSEPRDAIKILYTRDINKKHPMDFASNSDSFEFVKIDDEKQAEKLLSSILFSENYKYLVVGKIVLPKFCQPPSQPDEIQLEALEEFIDNFRHANKRGLVSVYPNKTKAMELIAQRLNKIEKGSAEEVRMIGFTLHRYTHPDKKDGLGKEFYGAIERGAVAKLLLLNRFCSAAKERMDIESDIKDETEYEKAVLYVDNLAVSDYYSKVNDLAGKVDIRYYKTPYVGMVLFKEIIFVEIYHLGHDGDAVGEKTICGRVPVLVVRKDSPFYNLFDTHFNRVWDRAEKNCNAC